MEPTSTIQKSLNLLGQLAEQAEILLEQMTPTEKARVLDRLYDLKCSSEGVTYTEEELLRDARSVCSLVEGTPTLTRLLKVAEASVATDDLRGQPVFRGVSTEQNNRALNKSSHPQEQAAQMCNRVAECENRLRHALGSATGSGAPR